VNPKEVATQRIIRDSPSAVFQLDGIPFADHATRLYLITRQLDDFRERHVHRRCGDLVAIVFIFIVADHDILGSFLVFVHVARDYTCRYQQESLGGNLEL
jgi:hypothetical protein